MRFRSGRQERPDQQNPEPGHPAGPAPGAPAPGDTRAFTYQPGAPGHHEQPYPQPQPPYGAAYGPQEPDGHQPWGADQGGYPQPGYAQDGYGQQGHDPNGYPADPDPGHGGYGGYGGYDGGPGHGDEGGGYGDGDGGDDPYDDGRTNVTTYRAGGARGPSNQPRLPWKQVLAGVVRSPEPTFAQMREHQVWGLALIASAVYGLLVIFGFGETRDEVFSSTFGALVPLLISAMLAFVAGGLMLGSVTHALARQLGGDGAWGPTASMSILVAWLTDVPRLAVALFVPTTNPVVQILAWATWLLCAVLLTRVVVNTHDLPWGKAVGACSLQLLALLVLVKLPTLS